MTILSERCQRIGPEATQPCGGLVIEEPDADRQIERTCINCGHVTYVDSRGEPVIARTIEEERALLKLAGVRVGTSVYENKPVRWGSRDKIQSQLRLV